MEEIQSRSLTHRVQKDFLSKEEIEQKIEEINVRLEKTYENNPDELYELKKLVNELGDFELGRFLIMNGSLSGYWTHYVIFGYKEKDLKNKTERSMVEALGLTRERFNVFQKILEKSIKDDSVCCSIPCGLMAEFITLNIDEKIKNLKFVGIDIDSTVFGKAKELVKKYNKSKYDFSFIKADAWNIKITDEFDVLTSNGLNIYEKNCDRVIELYKNFFNSLKPGGIFIGSASTFSEEPDNQIITEDVTKMQEKIYNVILEVLWCNFRTQEVTRIQLMQAGFKEENIQFYPTPKTFYTFVAKKI